MSVFDYKRLKEMGGYNTGCLISVDPEVYSKMMQHIGKIVKRDEVTKNMVLLTCLSAYTPNPLNLFLRGESSIGKTYNVTSVLKYFPKEDVWLLGGLSPTALIHDYGMLVDENGEEIRRIDKPAKKASPEETEAWLKRLQKSHYEVNLEDKILVFLEAPNIETFNKLRPILSHDAYEISYKFADKPFGHIQTMHVVLKGWPATIFCSTAEKYVQDLATRSLTLTPETTEDKYREANVFTGDKASFPWRSFEDSDFQEFCSFIRFLREEIKKKHVLIPYAKNLALNFPSQFPRSMRDFKQVVSLLKIFSYIHMFQRPILVRHVKEEEKEREELYVLSCAEDFEFVMELWEEIRETTETSAPAQIIQFFHDVVEKVEVDEFTVNDLTRDWNEKFPDRKSSDAIRSWVNFLCDIGYLTKTGTNPLDKRENLIKIIFTEKNRNCRVLDFSVIFKLDSLKEWWNEAKQISSGVNEKHNTLSLKDKFVNGNEMSLEDMYIRFFHSEKSHYKDESPDIYRLSLKQASLAEKPSEITEETKIVQFRHFKSGIEKGTVSLVRLSSFFEDKCIECGVYGRMDFQVNFVDGTWGLLCEKCGLNLEKQLGKGD